jgi:DNA-binding CsgD family transcriptional regulator
VRASKASRRSVRAPAPPSPGDAGGRRLGEIERARDAYRRRAWAEAHRCFAAIDRRAPLPAADLELHAWSAVLTGHDDQFLRLMARLYQLHLDAGDQVQAARSAFWLGLRLNAMREAGHAGGWFGRAQRLAESSDCVVRGYLLLPGIYRSLGTGDHQAAHAASAQALAIAERFSDAGLGAFARCLQGCALIRQGNVEAGVALLDEAMLAATTGDLMPLLTGVIYCSAIAGCSQAYVMDRSREWTAALQTWCGAQPDLVPFSGRCLVHRAELMQLRGDWTEAIEVARRAAARVARTPDPETAGDSLYQEAEVYRLRGDFLAAERGYRGASELGREAQPGLALLRLAQGRVADALSAIRGTLAATQFRSQDRLQRARFLPAYVEIALGAGDVADARQAAEELERIAADFGTEVLGAMAAHARGAVAIADGRVEASLEPLRRAFRVWHEVGAPYIAARLRVLLARACRALGDHDTAALEIDLARQVFQRLGAAPDLAALHALKGPEAVPATAGNRAGNRAGLSPRELQVLRLVAAGKTNRAIARELFLSERTIDRHVSNIFSKADVASRAAATAYAYQNGLV